MHNVKKEISIQDAIAVIRQLDEECLSTPIEHLQINRQKVKELKDRHIVSLLDLIQFAEKYYNKIFLSNEENHLHRFWKKIEYLVEDRFCQIADSASSGKINWLVFWESIDYEFTYAAAKLDKIFNFDDVTMALSVDFLDIGKVAILLKKNGVQTVGDLLPRLSGGLPDCFGIGKRKLWIFTSGLRHFISTLDSNGESSLTRIENPVPATHRISHYSAKNRCKMSEETKKLTLSQIHLHKEIKKLNRIGIQNLGQLLDFFADGLPTIRGIGAKARSNLFKIVTCVDASITESGEIDWEVFAKTAGFNMIPVSQKSLKSGHQFLASLGEVVQNLTTQYFDEVETVTLVDRLIPVKKDTMTLEEISRRFGLSRERVRQKQKEVIERISAAVLDNNYENLSFRFTQNFSQFWRSAAEHFSGTEVVTYNDFIQGLTIVWKVERKDVIPHLPLIYSILTCNLSLPTQFSLPSSLPPKIFRISHPPDLKKTYKALHPSRFLVKIIDQSGIKSIEQLIDVLRKDISIVAERTIYRLINEILDPLSSAVTSNGEIAWQEFYNIKGIKLLPDVDSDSPTAFADHVIETVSEFIRLTRISRRSCDIFRLRIVPESGNRKTLYETGKILECNGPQIKREENEIIERLHDAIYADDFSNTSLCFRLSFINYWKRARKIYRQCSNLERFAYLLSLEWGLPITEVSKIIPMLVCVIDGRPKGYTGKRYLTQSLSGTSQPECSESTNDSVVIRLRGFRNIH